LNDRSLIFSCYLLIDPHPSVSWDSTPNYHILNSLIKFLESIWTSGNLGHMMNGNNNINPIMDTLVDLLSNLVTKEFVSHPKNVKEKVREIVRTFLLVKHTF